MDVLFAHIPPPHVHLPVNGGLPYLECASMTRAAESRLKACAIRVCTEATAASLAPKRAQRGAKEAEKKPLTPGSGSLGAGQQVLRQVAEKVAKACAEFVVEAAIETVKLKAREVGLLGAYGVQAMYISLHDLLFPLPYLPLYFLAAGLPFLV